VGRVAGGETGGVGAVVTSGLGLERNARGVNAALKGIGLRRVGGRDTNARGLAGDVSVGALGEADLGRGRRAGRSRGDGAGGGLLGGGGLHGGGGRDGDGEEGDGGSVLHFD